MKRHRHVSVRVHGGGRINDIANVVRDAAAPHGDCTEVIATRTTNNTVDISTVIRLASSERGDINHITEMIDRACRRNLASGRFIYAPTGERQAVIPSDIDITVEPLDRPNRNVIAFAVNINATNNNTDTHDAIDTIVDNNGYQIMVMNQWHDVDGEADVIRQRIIITDKYPASGNDDLLRVANIEWALNNIDGVRAYPVRNDPTFILFVGNNEAGIDYAQENVNTRDEVRVDVDIERMLVTVGTTSQNNDCDSDRDFDRPPISLSNR